MATPATFQKRRDLMLFIQRVLAPEPAVQAVIGIGSIASGLARPDSDIDAIVFLDPVDPYIAPAEFYWRPSDGTFHSIFAVADAHAVVQFDLHRCDLTRWSDPSFEWPEERRAELQDGWLAFDRFGRVAELIASRTAYTDAARTARLDEAITWLDQHLSGDGPDVRWHILGPLIAHDRLHAAYGYLVQGLFAYNRRWRVWRNREMDTLLKLPWLPDDFANRLWDASCAHTPHHGDFVRRVDSLRGLFDDLAARLVADGHYGEDYVSEAFIRQNEEPGRAWNMEEWNRRHAERMRGAGAN